VLEVHFALYHHELASTSIENAHSGIQWICT